MKKSLLKSGLLLSTVATGVFASGDTHWGYTGHNGPKSWGELSPKYKMCLEGKNQSPINISKDIMVYTSGLDAIKFDYITNATEVINNGHTIQVNVKSGSSIHIDDKEFELKQFHFHTPSENQIKGKSFPLEAHFVHLDKDGNIAVIGVMFEESKKNLTLAKVWEKMPEKANEKVKIEFSANDIKALMPDNKGYYRFTGSLTTPPCSEGVRWMVYKDAINISKEQVEKFLHIMHHPNNRPVQPINARKVIH
jgi:carbonic anhydrase